MFGVTPTVLVLAVGKSEEGMEESAGLGFVEMQVTYACSD